MFGAIFRCFYSFSSVKFSLFLAEETLAVFVPPFCFCYSPLYTASISTTDFNQSIAKQLVYYIIVNYIQNVYLINYVQYRLYTGNKLYKLFVYYIIIYKERYLDSGHFHYS